MEGNLHRCTPFCPPGRPLPPSTLAHALAQVLGLWVILGIAMLVGAGMLGFQWFRVRAERNLKDGPPGVTRRLSQMLSRSASRAPSRAATAPGRAGLAAMPASVEPSSGGAGAAASAK